MKTFFISLLLVLTGSAHAAVDLQSWTLDNGAKVMFVPSRAVPMVDIRVDFDAGTRRDPEHMAGTAALTNALLDAGIREGGARAAEEPAMNEAQLSNAFADTGAERHGEVEHDRAGIALRTLARPAVRDRAVALLARILAQPAFPESLFVRDKARSIAALKEELTRPDEIASRAFWGTLYEAHPYGIVPTVASLERIAPRDIAAFHARHYVANRAIVSIVGAVSRQEADAIARQLTARLPQGSPLPALPAVPVSTREEVRIPHPASQAHLLIGAPALERSDPDYFPLLVGNYVLGGGGFVSRLMQEVREKRGLAYSAYSYFLPLAQQGPFQVGLQTQKERTQEALQVVRNTLSSFIRSGPQPAEVQAAKQNLIGGFALRIDTNRKILDNIAAIGFYDLPLDYLKTWTEKVARVDVQDIQAAFARKIGPERLETVIVGAGEVSAAQ